MEAVVLLPCVPAMAIPYLLSISLDSISALLIMVIFLFLAPLISGLDSGIADEITTKSAFSTLLSLWPLKIVAPLSVNLLVDFEDTISEPLIL
ncbi:hypothetical protein ES705_34905 [subsurface metagenome]